MSFSDLMSSSRGPGVIGLLMATVVLLGFGCLFMFAYEPNAQGEGRNIQAIIRDQSNEIDALRDRLNDRERLLEKESVRRVEAQSFVLTKASLEKNIELVANARQKVTDLNGAISAKSQEFEDYKNTYRQMARSAAKGETLPEIKTLDGMTYKKVILKEVTAVGIQISHEDGIKRIPFDLLPGTLQERFQYDPNQKEEALKREAVEQSEHDTAVDFSNKDLQRQAEKKKEAARLALAQQYNESKKLLQQKEAEIHALEAAIAAERKKKFSRAPAMEERLADKKVEFSALRDRVARLKSQQ